MNTSRPGRMYCNVGSSTRTPTQAYVDEGVQSNTRTLCIIPYRIVSSNSCIVIHCISIYDSSCSVESSMYA